MKFFPLTLWHGTSAHLLPTIEEHGLGGRNVMQDWRVMEFIQWALPLNDVEDLAHPDYLLLLPIKAAAKGGAGGMNFEYGDLYVAGGFHKAADYALKAPELMSFVQTLLDVADDRGVDAVREGLAEFPEIRDFVSLAPRPVVLKLPPIPVGMVELEKGGAIPMLDKMAADPTSVLFAQIAFRLKTVVPFDEIEVIDTRDHERTFVI